MIPGETVTSRKKLGLPVSDHVSPLQVMHTGAGYYVGTVYTHCGECEQCKKDNCGKGFVEPNSRETDYMKTREQAERVLAQMLADEEPDELRDGTFNEAGARSLEAVELPVGTTGEDIYRMIHPDDDSDHGE